MRRVAIECTQELCSTHCKKSVALCLRLVLRAQHMSMEPSQVSCLGPEYLIVLGGWAGLRAGLGWHRPGRDLQPELASLAYCAGPANSPIYPNIPVGFLFTS